MKALLVRTLSVAACFASALAVSAQSNYSNPISDLQPLTGYTADAHSDPRIIHAPDNNLWYSIFPNGTTYNTYRSPDLVSWPQTGSDGTTWPQTALSVSDLKTTGSSFWAAGVYAQKNSGVWTYYLFYTVNQGSTKSIGVATSTTAGHGYVDQGILLKGNTNCPAIDGAAQSSCYFYDAYVFQNPETGVIWLYFSNSMKSIFARKLTSAVNPGANGNTEPIALADSSWHEVLSLGVNTESWENVVMEHPTVVYFPNAANSGKRFQLLWNGSGGALPRYAIGAAYSGNPTTMFNKYPDGTCGVSGQNPIMCMTQTSQVCSTGSPNIFIDTNNQWWLLYRARYGQLVSSANKCSTGSEDWNDRWVGMDKLYRNSTTDALTITPTNGTVQAGPAQ